MYISKKVFNFLYWRLYNDKLAGVEDSIIFIEYLDVKYKDFIDEGFNELKYMEKIKEECEKLGIEYHNLI